MAQLWTKLLNGADLLFHIPVVYGAKTNNAIRISQYLHYIC
jgi:hypothetical protein